MIQKQKDLYSLRNKIADRNFSDVLNSAKENQREAKVGGLVTFGPNISKGMNGSKMHSTFNSNYDIRCEDSEDELSR
jgi:hypothetical protein